MAGLERSISCSGARGRQPFVIPGNDEIHPIADAYLRAYPLVDFGDLMGELMSINRRTVLSGVAFATALSVQEAKACFLFPGDELDPPKKFFNAIFENRLSDAEALLLPKSSIVIKDYHESFTTRGKVEVVAALHSYLSSCQVPTGNPKVASWRMDGWKKGRAWNFSSITAIDSDGNYQGMTDCGFPTTTFRTLSQSSGEHIFRLVLIKDEIGSPHWSE